MEKRHKKNRTGIIASTSLIILIIIVTNLISSKAFFRIDLTSEKRYTVSDDTKNILKNLNDVVFVRIYLDGELNIPFQNFQKSIIELLDEFKIYGRNNLEFEIVDPFENLDNKSMQNVLYELDSKGLKASNIYHRKKDGSKTEKIVIPGAEIIYKGVEVPVNLLVNNPAKTSEQNLNSSIESLEYNFISTIKNITAEEIEKIAFIEGHDEWPDPFVADIMKELSKSYQVDRGVINGKPGILDNYEAVVIAGPEKEFSEKDKYVIDQYIMQGGKVLWLIDAVTVDFDSLATGYSIALPNELNLDDMFFKYGVRINKNLIQDAQSSRLPVNVALEGEAPRFQAEPWIYYPLVSPRSGSIITNNLNKIQLKFASQIDTLEARSEIRKTPLLTSSKNSKALEIPRLIELKEINTPVTKINFDAPNQLLGILLEGKFESVFKNRMLSDYFDTPPPNRSDKSKETKMVIISDADIIRNEVKRTAKGPSIFKLGFDRLTNQTYGNKDFLVNVLNYLTDNSNLLKLRGREFKLRLLDRKKVTDERLKWQLINVLLPILTIITFGIFYNWNRKRKYTRN